MNLKNKKLFSLLQTLDIPVAYQFFKQKTNFPNIIYYREKPTTCFADDKVYFVKQNYTIEVYTENKDFDLEKKIEQLFIDNDIAYEKSEDIRIIEEDINLIFYKI